MALCEHGVECWDIGTVLVNEITSGDPFIIRRVEGCWQPRTWDNTIYHGICEVVKAWHDAHYPVGYRATWVSPSDTNRIRGAWKVLSND